MGTLDGLTDLNAVKTWRNRSEEHTSELQSQSNLVCRLLLEKKNVRRFGKMAIVRPEDAGALAILFLAILATSPPRQPLGVHTGVLGCMIPELLTVRPEPLYL